MLRNAQNLPDPAGLLLARQKKLREQLEKRNLDCLLVSSPANRFYLTGWKADAESGFVLITLEKSFIITDSRYSEHAAREADVFKIVEAGDEGIGPTLRELVLSENLHSVGFESHDLSVFSFKRIKRLLKQVKLVPTADLIEKLRVVKDKTEIAKIKKAVQIADKTFKHLLNSVRPCMSEREVAWEMEKFIKEEAGTDGLAWEPLIVAAGSNSSMAHWGATNTKIKENDMILVDFGCIYHGYCSDISRVVFIGEPGETWSKIYNLVLEAQKFGISLVKEGKIGETIDKKVRAFLEKRLPAGVDSKNIYRHALGHGVGLEVHERPSLNLGRKDRLIAGNVVSVEPGIYIPSWGGVRIEDLVLVTEKSREVLTKAPKQIEEVTI